MVHQRVEGALDELDEGHPEVPAGWGACRPCDTRRRERSRDRLVLVARTARPHVGGQLAEARLGEEREDVAQRREEPRPVLVRRQVIRLQPQQPTPGVAGQPVAAPVGDRSYVTPRGEPARQAQPHHVRRLGVEPLLVEPVVAGDPWRALDAGTAPRLR